MPSVFKGQDSPAGVAEQHNGLTVVDGIAVLVGVVIGIGIFGFPPLVAQQVDSPLAYMGLWFAGGVVMLIGALCYAELGSTYPHPGGEYHFLQRAWGSGVGLMFAWARGTVIQTGSIAAVAFIYGEYAQRLAPLGVWGAALHAAFAVAALTILNMVGIRAAKRVQILFSLTTILALAGVIGGGLLFGGPVHAEPLAGGVKEHAEIGSVAGSLGMGMVFVLLTYGGWNEAAYLSGELRNPQRSISRVLLGGAALVSLVYLLANFAYLHIFGMEGLRRSSAIGAQLMQLVAGAEAALLLSLMVCLTALSTLNATILTGARVYYALGRDVPRLALLGTWDDRGKTPTRALAAQGLICLGLVLFGALTKNGIATMVAYTAPVFWLFMMFTAIGLPVLRWRDPERRRPFRVPLYPLTPLLLAATCLGLLWSSTIYAGPGALVGLLVLIAGTPLLALRGRRSATTVD